MLAYILSAFSGWKTYLLAIMAALYAVMSVYYGDMTMGEAVEWFIASGMVAALRDGMNSTVRRVVPEPDDIPEPILGEGQPKIHKIPLVIGKLLFRAVLGR